MKKQNLFFAIIVLVFMVISCKQEEQIDGITWTEEESLKDAYASYFDNFGAAVTYEELIKNNIQTGLKHQFNSITMGNEFKPDFVFNWITPNTSGSFTGTNGTTIKVPTNITWEKVDKCLELCKKNNLKMRGHVLVWHSQTPEWFFYKDFKTNLTLVSKDEMNARMEWYIKTVVTHVQEWEKTNNNNKRIIYVWDVVNEAAKDNATATEYLRTESNWYKVYKDSSFIVNAFRYANKYVNENVELVYNDYNSYSGAGKSEGNGGKTNAILKIVEDIKAEETDPQLPTRINAVGMQSHILLTWPELTGDGENSFEKAVKRFIAEDLDVQITELDVANAQDDITLKTKYKDLFKLFLNYRKTETTKGISGVTIWGLTDQNSWLQNNYKTKQYPLLFTKDFVCKEAFYGVLEALDTL